MKNDVDNTRAVRWRHRVVFARHRVNDGFDIQGFRIIGANDGNGPYALTVHGKVF